MHLIAAREAGDARAAELSGLERMTREPACNLYKMLLENKDWPRTRIRPALRGATRDDRIQRLLTGQGAAHARRRAHPARPIRPPALSMIAQLVLSILLGAILLYAWIEYRRSPAVALLTVAVAGAGIYFV